MSYDDRAHPGFERETRSSHRLRRTASGIFRMMDHMAEDTRNVVWLVIGVISAVFLLQSDLNPLNRDVHRIPDGIPLVEVPRMVELPPIERDRTWSTSDPSAPPLPFGKTPRLIEITAQDKTPFVEILSAMGLPTGDLVVEMDGERWKVGLTRATIGADGKLVSMSQGSWPAWKTTCLVGLVLLAGMLAASAMENGRRTQSAINSWFALTISAATGFLIHLGALGVEFVFPLALLFPAMMVGPAAVRRCVAWMMAIGMGWNALHMPILAPHASLAHLYGRLGANAWDIASIGAIAAVSLALAIRRRSEIHVHQVPAVHGLQRYYPDAG